MQLTMNSNEVSVSSNRPNRFFSWFDNAAKKIAATFTKKKKPAVDKELAEAIRAIEWRTRYETQRIIHFVYAYSLFKRDIELYHACHVTLPVKYVYPESIKTQRRDSWTRLLPETQEVLGRFYENLEVNIKITDNSFERKLVRFFGNLKPATKQLLDGKKTETQRWAKSNARITELYLNRPPMHDTSKSLNGYEQQIVNALIASITTVPITTAPALLLPGTVTASVQSEEKIEIAAIDMVTETLPIEEITEQPIAVVQPIENKTVTLTEAEKLEKTIKGLKKLSLPDLKKFAIANNIHIRGKMTQITSIREKIVRELRKQAASQA